MPDIPKLNIIDFIKQIENLNYIIIKKPEHFPDYYTGSDLDIICDNKKDLIQKLLLVGNDYIKNHNFEIRVASNENTSHTKVDFYFGEILELRFDVHEGLPKFKNVKIRDDYANSLLERKQKLEITDGKRISTIVNTPSDIDELIFRYIEYFEWFERRPDKIKHLEYVEQHLNNDKERTVFFDRLHTYMDLVGKDDISAPAKQFGKNKLTKTDIKTKIKRELKYRAPLIYKTLIKIKRRL
ncbi:MAG: hypothetical protein KAV41_00130 [Candidatus Pacebacteria bacterium]|nr:hypothetical protein [Candidatus Paceibacterota bacterium]